MLISLLQKQIPLIDVRAPVEFSKGALPTSTNLPILFDEERELVGKAYKKLGGQSATELGHSIVKDKIKEHIGRSPDIADALMMRMYFELNKTKITYYG